MLPLRIHRMKRALTVRKLAELAGVQPGTIVRAEKGISVYVSTMRKIAQALGVMPEEISEFHQQIFGDPARSTPDPTPTTEAG